MPTRAVLVAAAELFATDDPRASEHDRQDELLSAGIDKLREHAETALIDAMVAATLVFLAEVPEAPRRRPRG
jgi:hypothetical protein